MTATANGARSKTIVKIGMKRPELCCGPWWLWPGGMESVKNDGVPKLGGNRMKFRTPTPCVGLLSPQGIFFSLVIPLGRYATKGTVGYYQVWTVGYLPTYLP
jgi:hypothetical protein